MHCHNKTKSGQIKENTSSVYSDDGGFLSETHEKEFFNKLKCKKVFHGKHKQD